MNLSKCCAHCRQMVSPTMTHFRPASVEVIWNYEGPRFRYISDVRTFHFSPDRRCTTISRETQHNKNIINSLGVLRQNEGSRGIMGAICLNLDHPSFQAPSLHWCWLALFTSHSSFLRPPTLSFQVFCRMTRTLLTAASILISLVLMRCVSAHPTKRAEKAVVYTKCSVPNTVALTFDDGPYKYLNDVVKTLNDAGAIGTFFFNGNNWACIYEEQLSQAVKNAFNSGHQIASHTWAHQNLTQLSYDDLHHEFYLVEQALQRIIGYTPKFVRPPYGAYNDTVLEVSAVRNQSIVLWDFDSKDTVLDFTVDQQKSAYDELAKSKPQSVLSLQHEVHETSVTDVLPHAIKTFKDANYTFVSVSECLGLGSSKEAMYLGTGTPAARDDTWLCADTRHIAAVSSSSAVPSAASSSVPVAASSSVMAAASSSVTAASTSVH